MHEEEKEEEEEPQVDYEKQKWKSIFGKGTTIIFE